jgi:iron complex transport system permease protein
MLQIIISPDVYNLIIGKLFANFNVVQEELTGISLVIILAASVFLYKKRFVLDVLSLGKAHSINLGIDYNKEVMRFLVVVFLLISLSTALVGPITFLGFFAVNIAKNYMDHYHHGYLMAGTCLIAVIVLFLGQLLVEHVFDFGLPISVLIGMIGGGYFIHMLLKENRK